MGRKARNIVVGLEMGTTKISAIIGEIQDDGMIDVIGIGSHLCSGLQKGVVAHMDRTVEAIGKAVEEAQIMAGVEVDAAYVGLAGPHISGINSAGIIAVKNQEITGREIERVIEAARVVALPEDREIIHVLPQEFVVDDQGGILEPPLGMSATRLEVKVHIVTVTMAAANNVIKCVNKAGFEVEDIVLEQLAVSEATLNANERDAEVLLIDIGGDSTNIALLSDGSLKFTTVLGIGGVHITKDLAIGLNTSVPDAEQIKKAHGCAYLPLVNDRDVVEVSFNGNYETERMRRLDICEIIEPRAEEIMQMVLSEINDSGYDADMISCVILTGGTASLEGVVELAEEVFQVPVRCGIPNGIEGLTEIVNNPVNATSVGLLLFAARQQQGRLHQFAGQGLLSRFYHRVRDWFTDFVS
jgi:cell division protein FtsA